MKRLISVLLLLALLSGVLPLYAYADSRIIQIDEPLMSLEIPADYYILTRNNFDNKALNHFGFTQEKWLEIAEASGFYLNAFSPDFTREIVVTMADSPLTDLSALPDTTISSVITPTIISAFSEIGYTVFSNTISKINGIKYFRLHFDNTESKEDAIQYSTIIESKTINVTFHNYNGKISEDDLDLVERLMNSISFGYETVGTSFEKTEPFEFCDKETGAILHIPANWKRAEFSEERQFLDAKFASTDGEGTVLYSSEDAWNKLNDRDKSRYKRSEYNLAELSDDDVKEAVQVIVTDIGAKNADYTKETIGGIEYLKINYTISSEVYGINVVLDGTSFTTIKNGYVYLYQFMGNETNPRYQDLIKILGNVDYPEEPKSELSKTTIVAVVTLSLLAIIIVGVILEKRKKKLTSGRDTQEIKQELSEETTSSRYCPYCGTPLPLRSNFCPNCGSSIPKQ